MQSRKRSDDVKQVAPSLQLNIELLRHMPAIAWTVLPDGTPDFANQQWLDYTGQTLEYIQSSPEAWMAALHPDDREQASAKYCHGVRSGQGFSIEARFRRASDGAYRWHLSRAVPLRDSVGNLVKLIATSTDIDDLKRADEALRESESRFRLIIDSIAGLVSKMTAMGEVEFVNSQVLEYFGKTLEDLKSWKSSDAVHPDDLARVVEAWNHAVKTGAPYAFDHRLRRADGVYRWFHAKGVPLRDSLGQISGWYVLLTDIDERKAAEEKLQSSEAYLSEAQRLSHTGSFGWDLDTQEIYWSAESFRIFDYEPSTRITIDLILQRVHPDDRPAVENVIAEASRDGKSFDFEHRLQMRDGSVKYVHVVGHPWHTYSGSSEFVGAVTDITELKVANEKLRRSEESLLEAQRISKTGSYKLDLVSGKVSISPEILRMYGIGANDELTQPDSWFNRIHPDDRQRVRERFESCVAQRSDYEADYRIVQPDGTAKYHYSVGHPVLNESGDLVEFVGTTMDVTDRHRLERALEHERDRLRLLLDLNNRVANQLSLPQLFQAIAIELRRVFKCDFVGIVSPESSGQYLRQLMVDYPGENKGVFKEGGIYPVDASCSGVAVRTAKPFMINDLSEGQQFWRRDENFNRAVRAEPFRSGCFLPMISGGQVLGVLQVTSLKAHAFTGDDVELLEQVAAQIAITLKNALQYEQATESKDRLHSENLALREQIDQGLMFEEIVGTSPPLQTVIENVVRVAPTDSTVLISGETGTGKELIARAIHKRSRRSSHAFISVNCASIPPSLIASELFGHEKGAFTGALQQRLGRFELARSGTIFLDEIGELPSETQIALLRVLQERQFERVGGSKIITADVRVIAATNRDLPAAIAAGTFRSDLYYRLNVFPVHVPPLRDRADDIPILVEYFVNRFGEKMGKPIRQIDRKTLELCQAYPWPGNVRELQNIVERSLILTAGDVFSIDPAWLPLPASAPSKTSVPLDESVQNQERAIIEAALAECKGRIAGPHGAAHKLGIPRATLDRKIQRLKIKKHKFLSDN